MACNSCEELNPCQCNDCLSECEECVVPIYTDVSCPIIIDLNCVTYNGNGNDCLGIEEGMTMEEVIDVMAEKVCVTTEDKFVKVSSGDTTEGYLNTKIKQLASQPLVTLTKRQTGANEYLEVDLDRTKLCEVVQECMVTPDNECDLYLNPGTHAAWITPALANSTIQNDFDSCVTIGLTVLCLNEAGNEQEYWYRDDLNTLVKKNSYLSEGTDSIAGGDPFSVAVYKNSAAIGHQSFTGDTYIVSSFDTGTNKLTLVGTAAEFGSGTKRVVLIDVESDTSPVWRGNVTNATGAGPTFTVDFSSTPFVSGLSYSSSIRLIKIVLDNTKVGSIAIGRGAVAANSSAFAAGTDAFAKGYAAIAIGKSKATGTHAVAIGNSATATNGGFAGNGGSASNGATAFKGTADNDSFALGVGCYADGGAANSGATAFGFNSRAIAIASTSIGSYSLAKNPNELAIGTGELKTANGTAGFNQYSFNTMVQRTTDATQTKLKFLLDGAYTGVNELELVGRVGSFKGTLIATQLVDITLPTYTGTVTTTAASDAKIWEIIGYWKDGTLITTTATPVAGFSSNSWAVALSSAVYGSSGTQLEIKVTGEANKLIDWHCHIELQNLNGRYNN